MPSSLPSGDLAVADHLPRLAGRRQDDAQLLLLGIPVHHDQQLRPLEFDCETLEHSLELELSDHRLFLAEIMSTVGDGAIGPEPRDLSPRDRATSGHRQLSHMTGSYDCAQWEQSLLLSRREHHVVRCLAFGLPNKAIARELNITEGTIKVHVKALLRKTKARNQTQLAIWAVQQSVLLGSDINDEHERSR